MGGHAQHTFEHEEGPGGNCQASAHERHVPSAANFPKKARDAFLFVWGGGGPLNAIRMMKPAAIANPVPVGAIRQVV